MKRNDYCLMFCVAMFSFPGLALAIDASTKEKIVLNCEVNESRHLIPGAYTEWNTLTPAEGRSLFVRVNADFAGGTVVGFPDAKVKPEEIRFKRRYEGGALVDYLINMVSLEFTATTSDESDGEYMVFRGYCELE
jgi:hypothetical protein